jgi:hypothetical protein
VTEIAQISPLARAYAFFLVIAGGVASDEAGTTTVDPPGRRVLVAAREANSFIAARQNR